MGGVDLPFVEPATTIQAGLNVVRARHRGALVVNEQQFPRLLKLAELAAARAAGKQTVGEAPGGVPLRLPAPPFVEFTLRTLAFPVLPLAQPPAGFLTTTPYAAGPAAGDTMLLLTSSETLISSVRDGFVCDGHAPDNPSAPHFFPDPMVAGNQACPFCVRTAGGKTPIVQRFE